jgi:hypothetical protein
MIKVGIIGLGYWGKILFNSISKNNNFEVVKVCGRDESNYGDIFTYNHEDVINSDAELIIISTQTKHHFEHIVSALKNDKHVFVEKPICLTVSEAKEVIDLANDSGKLLFVDHIYTTNPYVLKIKEILENDTSSLISYESLRYNQECTLFDTTIIENLMYHDFYIVNFLFGNIDFFYEKDIFEHIPFEWCNIVSGPIKLTSSYKDIKTRVLKIKTQYNEIYWDEVGGVLLNNDITIKVDTSIDNVNHKFNDIHSMIIDGMDDKSKDISLKILELVNQYEI